MALPFPDIHPVAFSVGPFHVYWYALSYIVGIFLSTLSAKYLTQKYSNGVMPELIEQFAFGAAIFGVIIGGRIGHVLFYDPFYYAGHPLEILMTWKGGMSFHGGLLGFLAAAWIFCRKHTLSFLQFMEVAAVHVPIALFLVRLANFINGELYGVPTTFPLGVIFPDGGPFPRHPTQLYEAFFEGLLLHLLLRFLWRTPLRHSFGKMSSLFLLSYGLSRFFIEFLKDPLAQNSQTLLWLNNGQLLCIPMIVLGIFLWWVRCDPLEMGIQKRLFSPKKKR